MRSRAAPRSAQRFGYDEINLNVGCPSGRVQNARFGACLMAEPGLVARCVAAMARAVDVPVTVKTRIGIDDQDSYGFLARLVEAVAAAGCETLILHARKALLAGLNPKQNRDIPPLRYDVVARVKRDFPALTGRRQRRHPHARAGARPPRRGRRRDDRPRGLSEPVLPGRLAAGDFGHDRSAPGREEVVAEPAALCRAGVGQGTPLQAITRHLMGLFNGLPGARAWRRHLSEAAHRPGAGAEVIEDALARLQGRADCRRLSAA